MAQALHQTGLVEIGDDTLEGRVIIAADLASKLLDCQPARVLVEQMGEGDAAEPLIGEVGG